MILRAVTISAATGLLAWSACQAEASSVQSRLGQFLRTSGRSPPLTTLCLPNRCLRWRYIYKCIDKTNKTSKKVGGSEGRRGKGVNGERRHCAIHTGNHLWLIIAMDCLNGNTRSASKTLRRRSI